MAMRPAPPRDEFDEIYSRSTAWVPGIFVIWVAVVRSYRALKRRFS